MVLEAWYTPFSLTEFPELLVIPAPEIDSAGQIIVRTTKFSGNTPTTFSVRYESWAGVKWEDESVAPNEKWGLMERELRADYVPIAGRILLESNISIQHLKLSVPATEA